MYLGTRDDERWKLPTKAETPMRIAYHPELNVSLELEPVDAAYYISLVGVLWWIVQLRQVDVSLECLMMSSHMAMPWEGHLYQLFQIFAAYLKKYHNT
jgi:hypothetical protein